MGGCGISETGQHGAGRLFLSGLHGRKKIGSTGNVVAFGIEARGTGRPSPVLETLRIAVANRAKDCGESLRIIRRNG